MGICSSCLGLRQGSDDSTPSETTRLLPPADYYYPPSPPQHAAPDPASAIAEREYLDRIVAQTSEDLIDIFAPPIGAPGSITPGTLGVLYNGILERTNEAGPFEHRRVEDVVKVLDAGIVGKAEREWLKGLVEGAEEAVREVKKIRKVGRLIEGLESL